MLFHTRYFLVITCCCFTVVCGDSSSPWSTPKGLQGPLPKRILKQGSADSKKNPARTVLEDFIRKVMKLSAFRLIDMKSVLTLSGVDASSIVRQVQLIDCYIRTCVHYMFLLEVWRMICRVWLNFSRKVTTMNIAQSHTGSVIMKQVLCKYISDLGDMCYLHHLWNMRLKCVLHQLSSYSLCYKLLQHANNTGHYLFCRSSMLYTMHFMSKLIYFITGIWTKYYWAAFMVCVKWTN